MNERSFSRVSVNFCPESSSKKCTRNIRFMPWLMIDAATTDFFIKNTGHVFHQPLIFAPS
jgi:hypothetical protein